MSEFVDDKGDKWVVRECGSDEVDCVVIERFMKRDGEDDYRKVSDDDVHVPLWDVVQLCRALMTTGDKMKGRA